LSRPRPAPPPASDDNADNDYSAGKAVQAWEYAEFDADELSDLTELLAHIEDEREKQAVTALLAGDVTQKEVARQLHVSEATLSRILAGAVEKLRGLAAIPAAADQEAAMTKHVLSTRREHGKLKQYPLSETV
jgi:DNA-directed RNA polymerase specialized sigma24 family protein